MLCKFNISVVSHKICIKFVISNYIAIGLHMCDIKLCNFFYGYSGDAALDVMLDVMLDAVLGVHEKCSL